MARTPGHVQCWRAGRTCVGAQVLAAPQWRISTLDDDAVQNGFQLTDIMSIGSGHDDRQRDTTTVHQQVSLAPIFQRELMPELRHEIGPLTSRLEKVIHTHEWVRVEEFVESSWCGVGWPPHDRGALGAFVAKAVLGLTTTTALIEPRILS